MKHRKTRKNSMDPPNTRFHGSQSCGWSGPCIGESRKKARKSWKAYLKSQYWKDE